VNDAACALGKGIEGERVIVRKTFGRGIVSPHREVLRDLFGGEFLSVDRESQQLSGPTARRGKRASQNEFPREILAGQAEAGKDFLH